jgi:hypothetical protein
MYYFMHVQASWHNTIIPHLPALKGAAGAHINSSTGIKYVATVHTHPNVGCNAGLNLGCTFNCSGFGLSHGDKLYGEAMAYLGAHVYAYVERNGAPELHDTRWPHIIIR